MSAASCPSQEGVAHSVEALAKRHPARLQDALGSLGFGLRRACPTTGGIFINGQNLVPMSPSFFDNSP
eukprot:1039584-Pyramimonas_sp.AAC.1